MPIPAHGEGQPEGCGARPAAGRESPKAAPLCPHSPSCRCPASPAAPPAAQGCPGPLRPSRPRTARPGGATAPTPPEPTHAGAPHCHCPSPSPPEPLTATDPHRQSPSLPEPPHRRSHDTAGAPSPAAALPRSCIPVRRSMPELPASPRAEQERPKCAGPQPRRCRYRFWSQHRSLCPARPPSWHGPHRPLSNYGGVASVRPMVAPANRRWGRSLGGGARRGGAGL